MGQPRSSLVVHVAEIMNEPIGMPRELAARLLVAIVDEWNKNAKRSPTSGDGNAEIGAVSNAD